MVLRESQPISVPVSWEPAYNTGVSRISAPSVTLSPQSSLCLWATEAWGVTPFLPAGLPPAIPHYSARIDDVEADVVQIVVIDWKFVVEASFFPGNESATPQ